MSVGLDDMGEPVQDVLGGLVIAGTNDLANKF